MNIVSLSLAYLRHRRLTNSLLVILLALGMAVISLLLHVSQAMEQRFTRDAAGIDLVVGAKGSPLQLILSSIYHIDIPTGNIPLHEAEALSRHRMVKQAIPLALGDSYHGFRIVGTDHAYRNHYDIAIASGEDFSAPMEAIIGAGVAKETGLTVGGEFKGSHGLVESDHVHEEVIYKVVGIMAPTDTVLNRLILTPVESVWQVHGQAGHESHAHDHHEQVEKDITALLITYQNKIAAMSLPRMVNRNSSMQAASPALEVARLLTLLGVGLDMLRLFGAVLVASAMVGIIVALYQSLQQRRYDLAVMYALGGRRSTLVKQIMLETLLLVAIGVVLGLALSRGAMWVLPMAAPTLSHLSFTAADLLAGEALTAGGLLVTSMVLAAALAYKVTRKAAGELFAKS